MEQSSEVSSSTSSAASSSTRRNRDEEVQGIFEELKEQHLSKYDDSRLRLWARMIASNIHADYSNPPNVPIFNRSMLNVRNNQ